ncbi:MAG: hypothetical protein ACI8SJ_001176 [Shewanella sp.]|jgi:hypothetical protein
MPYSHVNPGAHDAEICLSVIVPLFNDSQMIAPLILRLTAVLFALDESSEIVFVDDGSKSLKVSCYSCLF